MNLHLSRKITAQQFYSRLPTKTQHQHIFVLVLALVLALVLERFEHCSHIELEVDLGLENLVEIACGSLLDSKTHLALRSQDNTVSGR